MQEAISTEVNLEGEEIQETRTHENTTLIQSEDEETQETLTHENTTLIQSEDEEIQETLINENKALIQSDEIKPVEASDEEQQEMEEAEPITISSHSHNAFWWMTQLTKLSAETLAGAALFYTFYLLWFYDLKEESKYGYGLVAAGGLLSATFEILHLKSALSVHQYHNYRLVKEALAGASVAASVTEEFLSEAPAPTIITLGTLVLTLLATSKALIEIFQQRPFFRRPSGKILQYGMNGIYDLLMGASITEYVVFILGGFNVRVPVLLEYTIPAGVGVTTLLTGLPITQSSPTQLIARASHGYRACLYAAEIMFFLMILLLDIITDVQASTELSNATFYTVLGICIAEGLIVMANKLVTDKEEAHFHQNHGELVVEPLLAINHDEASPTSCASVTTLLIPCCNFWHRDVTEEEAQTLVPHQSNAHNNRYLPSCGRITQYCSDNVHCVSRLWSNFWSGAQHSYHWLTECVPKEEGLAQ